MICQDCCSEKCLKKINLNKNYRQYLLFQLSAAAGSALHSGSKPAKNRKLYEEIIQT